MKRKGYQAKQRNTGSRKRKKVVLISAEGKNKTETFYFSDFSNDDTSVVFASGNATDPVNMAHNLVSAFKHYEMDKTLGDAAFCVLDGDLSEVRAKQIAQAEKIVREIQGSVIVSNPCI